MKEQHYPSQEEKLENISNFLKTNKPIENNLDELRNWIKRNKKHPNYTDILIEQLKNYKNCFKIVWQILPQNGKDQNEMGAIFAIPLGYFEDNSIITIDGEIYKHHKPIGDNPKLIRNIESLLNL